MEFISPETIRMKNATEKKQMSLQYRAPKVPAGEMAIEDTGAGTRSEIFTREMLARAVDLPSGEMMSVEDLHKFAKQAVLDVSLGMAEHPALYSFIYEEIKNADFPRTIKVMELIGMRAAFGVTNDGESVPMADFKFGKLDTVEFKTFAAGYSISRGWVNFNEFWKLPQASKALGIAHNAILDHLHLSPIITHSYTGNAVTNKVTTGSTDLENVWLTLRQGLKDALKRTNAGGYRIRPTIALCNSATAMDVEAAIKGLLQKGTQLGQLAQIQSVLSYDGWTGEVGGIKYEFKAPADNEVYLIVPKRSFKALVKEDLTHLEQRGNILTLSELDVVETFTRCAVAGVADAVHKVKLA